MTSWEYFVGFEREPKDLDAFLDRQGYERIPNKQGNSIRDYESRVGGLVELFFTEDFLEVEEGEVPDWRGNGYNVTSELMISTKDFSADLEAQRIANETTKKYKAVIYDPQIDEFFKGGSL